MPKNNSITPSGYAFLGGTFDPVHLGHLAMAEHARHLLAIDTIALMPSGQPVHRHVVGRTAQQRLDMLKLAIKDSPEFIIDDAEVLSENPSFTITSLERLRVEYGPSVPLVMVMGMDSLTSLASWYRWQELLDFCHIFVCARPGYELAVPSVMQAWFDVCQTDDIDLLRMRSNGRVYVSNNSLMDVSATELRASLAAAPNTNGIQVQQWLPDAVRTYIKTHQLYGVN